MRDFGWSYPPGAANDPRAPWNDWGENQDDEEELDELIFTEDEVDWEIDPDIGAQK
jgi:hypothetical protein